MTIQKIEKYFWYAVLVILGIKFLSHELFHQLLLTPHISQNPDLAFRLFRFSGIHSIILRSPLLAILLDGILICTALFNVLGKPGKWSSLLFLIAFVIYFLLYNSLMQFTEHKLIPLLFFPWLSIISSQENKLWLLKYLRFYFFFIFFSAALWKIFRLNWLDADYFKHVLLLHFDVLPLPFQTNWAQKIIEIPYFPASIYLTGILFELSFGIGFLTKKYDMVFVFTLILFIMVDYLFMQINFYEYFIWILVLLPFHSEENLKILK